VTEGIVRVTSVDEVAGINESKDLSEGDVFGLLGLVPNMPSADTASAVTDVRAAMLTRHPYEQLFTAAPALARPMQ
jgi:CRP-like cAMP-binding protein